MRPLPCSFMTPPQRRQQYTHIVLRHQHARVFVPSVSITSRTVCSCRTLSSVSNKQCDIQHSSTVAQAQHDQPSTDTSHCKPLASTSHVMTRAAPPHCNHICSQDTHLLTSGVVLILLEDFCFCPMHQSVFYGSCTEPLLRSCGCWLGCPSCHSDSG